MKLHLLNSSFSKSIVVLLAILFSGSGIAAQACENCAYYDVNHLSRVEGHPVLGEWDELWTLCVPFDSYRDFRVTADGTTASKFEVSLVVFGPCIYENEDPMVEFVDENFEPVTDPTPEEYGVITVISMTSTTVFFEYTHPTDLPPAGEKFRQVRIVIKDYSMVSGEYGTVCWMVINIYRPPVLLVHGLWANAESFEAMQESMVGDEYEEQMVVSANYQETNGDAFATNSDVVPTGINYTINQCRDSYMSAGKINLVGHSMGGILSRLYLQNAYHNDVYRLVTCNTPHSGSQAANYLRDPYWWPQNLEVCTILGALSMPCYNGAVADLSVDSAGIAYLNSGIHPPNVGVHALITTKESPLPSALEATIISKVMLMGVLVHLANTCGAELLDTLFEGDVHDFVVASESQKGGLGGATVTMVDDQEHIGSTANPTVIDKVKQLLNEPFSSAKFTQGGYNPPDLSYNNMLSCGPFLKGGNIAGTRSSSTLTFTPSPGAQSWSSGDTAEITVTGVGVDTIVLVFETNSDMVHVQKKPGPEATFILIIPETQGAAGVVAFGYSAAEQLIGSVADTMQIDLNYVLTGISVFPTKIFSNIGDTTDFQVIGHYDDNIDRSLNGNPNLTFTFTTWSASPTSEDDILLNFAMNDTLVVSIDTFSSPMVKIYFEPDPTGPVFWLGGTGDWNDDSKWDIGCPPGPANTVYILTGECTIPSLIPAHALAMEVTDAALIIDGQLTISGSTGTALHIKRSMLENNGDLNISDVTNTAFWLEGTSSDSAFFVNNGDLAVNTCSGTYGFYISTRTSFVNTLNGTVTINNCGATSSMEIQSGISGYTLDNQGSLQVNGGSINGVGRILNSGTLSVIHSIPEMYGGLTCAFLQNTSTGTIQLENIFNAALSMSYTTDSLINAGQIIVNNTNDKGIWVQHLRNSGSVEVSNIADEGIFMEANNILFENTFTGCVHVSNCGTGIYTRNTGARFENQGSITIDSIAGEAILVKFNSVFENDTTGEITITQTGTHGVYILDNTNTVFNNAGSLNISGTTEHGLRVHGNGAFNNLSTGNVHIYDIGSSGLTTTGTSLHGNTLITNTGRIAIQIPIGQYGIDQTKKFTNDACGVIVTEAPLRSASPNFINNGFMHLRGTAAHTVTSTANKIVNNGWIEDYEGLLDLSTQVTNNAAIAAPVPYGGCSGVDVMDVFAIGSLSGYTITDGYTDHDLSILAGTFDIGTNTFVPNSTGILSPDWYFGVTDDSDSCTDTIQVKAQATCPVNCSGDPLFWTGCADSDWADPDNWNLGTLPTSVDTVTITGLPAGGFFPEILTTALIRQLDLKPGAIMTVKTGGNFSIEY